MLKIAQCWDDGVLNDIRLTELLRKYGAKATFNLNPGLHEKSVRMTDRGYKYKGIYYAGKLSLDELASVYDGFQVASHTMRHAGAGDMPDADFVKDAVEARKYLEDRFRQNCPGFAWPCGRFTEGTVKGMREAGFSYGRTVRKTDRVIPCEEPMTLDPSCHFQDPGFWNIFEKARETGVFYFWGHSYEMMDEAVLWRDFEEKLARISSLPDLCWVDVADLVKTT